jgi:hypothetical protein
MSTKPSKFALATLVGATLLGVGAGRANAQFSVNPEAPSAPTNLDPAGQGNQMPAPAPRTTAPAQPTVVTVGPDGKISSVGGAEPTEPTNFYHFDNDLDTGTDTNAAEMHTGPVPELHVVRRGDTLWDICWFYFNDPWQWPKIWSYNAQITNPHWIYPGDLVRLLPKGVFTGATPPPPDPDAMKVATPTPPPARKTEVGLKQIAFVEKADLDRSIEIAGAVDEKELLGNGDNVYLSYPEDKVPEIGKRYSIYEAETKVKSHGKELGSYVRILGTVEIASVLQNKLARGVIVESNREIMRGAKVGTLLKEFKNVPPLPPTVDAQGSIVAMLSRDELIGQGEIVITDLGEDSGVVVGNRLFVVRRGDAHPGVMDLEAGQDDRRFPARALGEVVIVEVGKGISIGLVTLAVQELGVGDLVMMQKTK